MSKENQVTGIGLNLWAESFYAVWLSEHGKGAYKSKFKQIGVSVREGKKFLVLLNGEEIYGGMDPHEAIRAYNHAFENWAKTQSSPNLARLPKIRKRRS